MIVNTSAVVGAASGAKFTVFDGAEVLADPTLVGNDPTTDGNPTLAVGASHGFPETDPTSQQNATSPQDPTSQNPRLAPSANVEEIDEDRFWEEMKLVAEMRELEDARKELEVELADAKRELSEADEVRSEAKATVTQIEEGMREKTNAFIEVARKLCVVAAGGALTELDQHASATPAAEPDAAAESEEGWKLHPTSDLLSDIKGSKGKKDSLIEICPTLGHLVELHKQAGIEHKSLKEMLPKGCGQKFADEVEDSISQFFARWHKQRANPEATTASADQLVAEIREAAKQNGWTKEDCEPKDTDSEFLRAGFNAYNEGRPHTDVFTDDAHKAKQWMTGWVGGEIFKKLET